MDKLEEIISYRGLLYRAIEDARKNIADFQQIYEHESGWKRYETTVINSVRALFYIIQNHGDSTVKDDVEKANVGLWDKYEKKHGTKKYHMGDYGVANLHITLFGKIMFILNKHNMLFDEAPIGYTNVVVTGVSEGGEDSGKI